MFTKVCYNAIVAHRTVVFWGFALVLILIPYIAQGALIDQVNQAFRQIYGRSPSYTEWQYWAGRVQRGEKKTYGALVGAIAYQKGSPAQSSTVAVSVPTSAAATSFKISSSLYPSSRNPNFLPDGTLVKSAASPTVFYIKNGNKSWVLPAILAKWLGEAHYFNHDVVTTISAADLARYPQTTSVNPLYIGKILRHPNGTQYFIDDKLRKRKISAGVRGALKFPSRNLYPVSAAHLREFKAGPAVTRTDVHPPGTVMYNGAYHGGTVWRVEEIAGGKIVKRLYLQDYIYETEGYPWSSQIMPVSAAELARYARGSNIERYPDGVVVGLGSNIYVVSGGKLRLIGSPSIFSAMGYKQKYVLKVFPEFLKKYPRGTSISAFKTITTSGAKVITTSTPAPSTSSNLIKVRAAVRALINKINDIYLIIYDKQVTASENKFWVDYVYNGEVNNETDLKAVMRRAKTLGRKPALTSRTAKISLDTLRNKWFPYLFYFVHQQEPSEADRNYWYGRIRSGDRDTIERLGGTLQWLKDTSGVTHK